MSTLRELQFQRIGFIEGFIFNYDTTTSIEITFGEIEANGKTYILSADTTHAMTSLASAFDFHYIYIDDSASTEPTAVIIDSTTEPTFSVSKNGWYNGDDRCIGAIASTTGASTILYFESMAVSQKNIRLEYGRRRLGELASSMDPDGSFQIPNTVQSSTLCPVTSIEAHFEALCFDTSAQCSAELATQEMALAISQGAHTQVGFDVLYTSPWVPLFTSRNIRIKGQADDDNTLALYMSGYGFSR